MIFQHTLRVFRVYEMIKSTRIILKTRLIREILNERLGKNAIKWESGGGRLGYFRGRGSTVVKDSLCRPNRWISSYKCLNMGLLFETKMTLTLF